MRCRRLHQGTCHGPVHKGLCAKHRTEWEAMQADWNARAKAAPTPPKRRREWAPEDDTIVRTHTILKAAALLDLPHQAVTARRNHLGIKQYWTADMDAIIRTSTVEDAATTIGISKAIIVSRRRELGVIGRTAWTTEELETLAACKTRAEAVAKLPARSWDAIDNRFKKTRGSAA